MPISLYLDNNIWDLLHNNQIDLAHELPKEEFHIIITLEAEFEIPPIRSPELKEYISTAIKVFGIGTDAFFGFNDPALPPEEQRCRGFDLGRFASSRENEFINEQRSRIGKLNPITKLNKYEADIALAARSFHSFVLTADVKPGPLRDAYNQGGKVIFLANFNAQKLSLYNAVKSGIAQFVEKAK